MPNPAQRPITTDEDARRIAELIVRAVSERPDPANRDHLILYGGSQRDADTDEDRIELALVDIGAVPPELTLAATRARQ